MSLLLFGARAAGGAIVDVRIDGEHIAEVGPAGALATRAADEALDLDGYVLLPALAEPHAHLDKAFTADAVANAAGDLPAAIAAWRAYRRELASDDIAVRARRAALASLEYGVTAIRTHVDVGEGIELRGVEALLAVRDELRELVDIQISAMAYPLTGAEGEENRGLMREALRLGVDVVGGAPHVDPDPEANLRWTLELAAEHGRPVDLHMDEHLSAGLDLPLLAELVMGGFGPDVTASHCSSLGMCAADVQDEVAAAVARAGVSVVTLPLSNLMLQGRGHRTAVPRGITAVRALLDAGVELAGGGDNVQDPYNPLGRGDPLQTAQMLIAVAHVDVDAAVDLVTRRARRVMGLPELGLVPGRGADLVAIAAASVREAVATTTEDRVVVRRGRVVARTRVRRG